MTAAADPGGRSGLGWLILAAALAVPGFLFYNWSSRLKSEHDRGISAKARTRLDNGVFQTAPTSARLVNPISPAPAAPAAKPAPAAVPTPAPPAAARPAVAAAPAPAPAGAVSVAPSSAAAATIVLPRDPMLSPLDLVHLREAEEAKARAAAALKNGARPGRVRRSAPRPVEKDIYLQGIVTTPGGDSRAIINGDTVGSGATFRVARHAGLVKVLSISADTVVFQYGNRRFKKIVSKD